MLTDIELEQLFYDLKLPETGRQLVRSARINSPVRKVSSKFGNSVIEKFSRKMGGRHLSLESRTVESPAAALHEEDPEVLEYWPQPCCEDLEIKDENGKVTSRKQHYPDFLIIRREGITIEEWREESRLMKYAAKGSQFYKDEEGWHYRSAEEKFGEKGIIHKVRSALELPRTFIENIWFLEDYQRPEAPKIIEEIERKLINIVSVRGSIAFLELLHDHSFCADDIFKAIVQEKVYVDLFGDRLSASTDLVIHRDKAIASAYRVTKEDSSHALPIPGMAILAAGALLKFDGRVYEVLLVGSGKVLLGDGKGQNLSLPLDDVITLFENNDIDITGGSSSEWKRKKSLADFSHKQVEEANRRLKLIKFGNDGTISERTLYRWKSRIDDNMPEIDKLIALVDKTADRGNKGSRLPETVESLAEEAIRKHYNTPDCQSIKGAYGIYQDNCENADMNPMSYPTFSKRVKNIRSTRDREGKRTEYQTSHIPLYLDYGFPIHGVRPHDVCYIDHTTFNLATVGPEGSALGKPTLSIATDGHTTQPRALYASYDPPSAKVVLMVLRDYVRRNKRLPKTLVVDGGPEFRSKYLRDFCRIYEIDLRHRTGGKPRGGSPVERAIGATEEEVVAGLKGNTRIMKNARMVTKSVNPFPRAEWTLTAIHGALEEYLFEIRPNVIHPAFGVAPSDYEKMRIQETGLREHVLVRFDQNLMLMTSPHPHQKYHKIDPIRGVWADYTHYWHDDFKGSKAGEQVEVRIEPWCAIVIYVYYKNRWIAAIARDLRRFFGITKRELETAIRAEKKTAKTNSNKTRLGKTQMKKIMKLMNPANFDPRIREQQKEMVYLYSGLGMTTAIDLSHLLDGSRSFQIQEDATSLAIENTSPSGATQNLEVIDVEPQENHHDTDFWGGVDGYF